MAENDMISQAIYALADTNGGKVTPEQVLAAASEPSHPLHGRFTWNDSDAAHQHRLDQARSLIRSVRVDVRHMHFSVKAPAFVRDPSAGSAPGYISIGRLRTDEDQSREAVLAEFKLVSTALARAKAIALALGLGEQIEEIENRVINLTRVVQAQATA